MAAGPPSSTAPHIVLLLIDSFDGRLVDPSSRLRRAVPQLPSLDAMAAHGTNFVSAYTPSPQCTPARAALLTGRRPDQTWVFSNREGLAGCSTGNGTCASACATSLTADYCEWLERRQHGASAGFLFSRLRHSGYKVTSHGKIDVGFELSASDAAWGGFHTGPVESRGAILRGAELALGRAPRFRCAPTPVHAHRGTPASLHARPVRPTS